MKGRKEKVEGRKRWKWGGKRREIETERGWNVKMEAGHPGHGGR